MSDTVRTVKTEFTAEDKGLGALQARLTTAFTLGAHKLEGFREKLSEFRREQGLNTLAAFGLGAGLGAWLEKAKEGNAEFEKTKKGIAGVLSGALDFKKGTSEIERYNQSLAMSGKISEDVEDTAARFSMQFEDVAEVYKKVALSAGDLGLSQKQVGELMVSTAATAARFQVSGETAANTIARAMKSGAVRGVDEFSISLGRAIGNMHKLTQAQRFIHIQKALGGSVDVADAMSGGVGGSLIRIRNEITKTIRELTTPIFGDVAKRLEAWGKHIREAKDGAKPLIDEISGRLLTAFRTMADVIGTIKEHWMAIAGIVAGAKVTKLADRLSTVAEGIAGGGGTAIGGAMGGAAGMLGTLAKVTIAASAVYLLGALAGEYAAGKTVERVTDIIRLEQAVKDLTSVAQIGKKSKDDLGIEDERVAKRRLAALEKMGIVSYDHTSGYDVSKGYSLNGSALSDLIKKTATSGDIDFLNPLSKEMGINMSGGGVALVSSMDNMTKQLSAYVSKLFDIAGPQTPSGGVPKFGKRDVVNITGGIHIQWKNEETDPDRAFLRFTDKFENYIHKKTQAYTAEALGD